MLYYLFHNTVILIREFYDLKCRMLWLNLKILQAKNFLYQVPVLHDLQVPRWHDQLSVVSGSHIGEEKNDYSQ